MYFFPLLYFLPISPLSSPLSSQSYPFTLCSTFSFSLSPSSSFILYPFLILSPSSSLLLSIFPSSLVLNSHVLSCVLSYHFHSITKFQGTARAMECCNDSGMSNSSVTMANSLYLFHARMFGNHNESPTSNCPTTASLLETKL